MADPFTQAASAVTAVQGLKELLLPILERRQTERNRREIRRNIPAIVGLLVTALETQTTLMVELVDSGKELRAQVNELQGRVERHQAQVRSSL